MFNDVHDEIELLKIVIVYADKTGKNVDSLLEDFVKICEVVREQVQKNEEQQRLMHPDNLVMSKDSA